MPLGNLTSQFFANVYLNELDQFVKHGLKVKYYIRYVDDFVIIDNDKVRLLEYKTRISEFLETLNLKLHTQKSKIIALHKGIDLLGFRMFYYHKLLKKSNILKMQLKLLNFKEKFYSDEITYDEIYVSLEGWSAYTKYGNTYNLRVKFIKNFEQMFPNQIADIEMQRWLKHIIFNLGGKMAENEQTIGQVEKNASIDIVIRVSEFQGRLGVDIREYQKSGSYTGPTNKGIRIPVEKWKEVKELLDKVDV